MGRPTATAIAAELREAISTGRYGPGVQLPSASALQARHGVARGTVTTAVEMLKREGLVTSRPGAGWFVTEPTTPEDVHRARLPTGGRDQMHVVERVTTRPASLADAERFHTALGSPLLEIHRVSVYPDGTTTPQEHVTLTAAHALVYELPAEEA
jgi:GntR family transcriptional regulator